MCETVLDRLQTGDRGAPKRRSAYAADPARAGFTLLELSISSALLVIISFLTFVVTQAVVTSQAIAEAKEAAQESARNTLTVMAQEVQLASKTGNPALNPPLQAITVVSPTEVVFQVPADSWGTAWSAPITYRFISEDENGNAQLDEDEDTNGDKALTRHVVRIQGDGQEVMGAANNVAAVRFALSETGDVLTIEVTATKAAQTRRHELVSAAAASNVYLTN